ncbi:alginate lyase family protein [Lentisphaera profundi]|uniref:Alginate lyase family protein n=1 Tax=Lentisphaera profundi TaxID=1658616 RepID=A0ABY7VMG9_9BACT|nr:alginate lyase family protein [Lentisphaera profundi]WDE95211.1 alginate lyase family protein [Lentisphaera profundi]
MNKILLILIGLTMTSLTAAETPMQVKRHVNDYLENWRNEYDKHQDNYSIQQIAKLLDLNLPGLNQLKAAIEEKNYAKAKSELLRYYQDKFSQMPAYEALDQEQIKIADQALAHIIKGNKNYPPAFRGLDLDWIGKAVIKGQVIHSKEWLFQYQRLNWWNQLAKRYSDTKDESYFNEWLYEMITHHRSFPELSKAPWCARRGMETDNRCANYIKSIPFMIKSSAFDAETLLFFLGTFHKNAEHIRRAYSKKGNHLIGELTQVLVNGVEMPEFKKASEWRAEPMSRLPGQLFKTIYNDGINREMVFSYHTMYIELFSRVYEITKKHGIENQLPEDFAPLVKRMHGAFAEFMLPDFTVPQFGDAWKYRKILNGLAESRYGYLLDTYAQRYPNLDSLNYFAKRFQGQPATPPAARNAQYPESGFYSFRNGWDEDSSILILKNSIGGPWHNQPDNGTFLLYSNGRNFMSDSGSYIYGSSNPDDQAWRQWFQASRNHQTLTLNGKDVDSKPYSPEYLETENWAKLKVANQSYPGLRHDRTIWFIDQKYFLIMDEATGSAAGEVQVHYQLNPAPVKISTAELTAATTYKDGNNLLVQGIPMTNTRPSMNTEEGWVSYFITHKEARSAWNYSLHKTTDKPVRFLTLLVPQKNLKNPPQISIQGKEIIVTEKDKTLKLKF